jgi:predicted transcriptional regulator
MTPEQLITLNQDVRSLITDYLEKHQMSLYQFSKKAGIHQNQLYIYLNGQDEKKGLHSGSFKKLGIFMSENP